MPRVRVIMIPPRVDLPGMTDVGYRFLLDLADQLNKSAHGRIPTYANDTAAKAGGLVAGDYYRTSSGEVRVVAS